MLRASRSFSLCYTRSSLCSGLAGNGARTINMYQKRFFCEKDNAHEVKGEDFWEKVVGTSGTPRSSIPPDPSDVDKKIVEERIQGIVDSYIERGGKVGDAITEEEFDAKAKKNPSENTMSLFDYAKTLQGKEKEEFEAWLNDKMSGGSNESGAEERNQNFDDQKPDHRSSDRSSSSSSTSSGATSSFSSNSSSNESESDIEVVDEVLNKSFQTESDFEGINSDKQPEVSENELMDEFENSLIDKNEIKKKILKAQQQKKEEPKPPTAEEIEEWERQQEERAEKVTLRTELRKHRLNVSLGTVTLPQGLRDRIQNLITKYYKKKKYYRPILHVGKSELDEEDQKRIDEIPTKQERTRIPSRAENRKIIRQALHAHIFSDVVDAKQMACEGSFPQIIFGKAESLAYVENFTTGQYAIIHRIFHEIETLLPELMPRMVLDFGSGPGTTLFAVDEIWGENIMKHYLAVEPSSAMLDISQQLSKYDTRALYRRYLSMGKEVADYDIVVSSCSFTYLQTARERRDILRSLWRSVRPGGVLVFSEIGSPVGFQMVKHVRELLLAEDVPAKIIAPCPHQFECPMSENSWCHLKQRTFLLAHERVSTTRSYRDVPMSYIVAQKPSVLGEVDPHLEEVLQDPEKPKQRTVPKPEKKEETFSRVVRQPRKRGGHIHLDLCTPKGTIKKTTITRRKGKDFYASARKLKWMDGFVDPDPVDEPEPEPEFEDPGLEELARWKEENAEGVLKE